MENWEKGLDEALRLAVRGDAAAQERAWASLEAAPEELDETTERFLQGAGMALEALNEEEGDTRPRLEEALELLEEALEGELTGERRHAALAIGAEIHLHLGHAREQVGWLEEAVEVAGERARAEEYWLLANAYREARRPEDALEAVDEGMASEPGERERIALQYLRALLLVEMKREEEGAADIEWVVGRLAAGASTVANGPTLEDAQRVRETIRRGDEVEAEVEWTRATLEARVQKAGELFKAGEFEGARKILLEVVARHGEPDLLRCDALNFLAECQLQLGEYGEAVKCYQEVLGLEAADEHAREHAGQKMGYAKASQLFAEQKYEAAQVAYRDLYSAQRHDNEFRADVALRLGFCELRMGNKDAAKDWMEGVLTASFPSVEQKQTAAEALQAMKPKGKGLFGWFK